MDGWSFHRPIINNHTRQGWPALSSYLKIGRGGDVEGEQWVRDILPFFPLKLESEHLPPAFSLQPSKKNRKSEAKRQPNDSS